MSTTESEMKIGALAPWFGSKRTLAPVIVQELGKHRAYWEPFCGSMAVLLNKPEAGHETVNDLHGDLINLARVIQHDRFGPELYRRAKRVILHESTLDDAWSAIATLPEPNGTPDVDRALHYFVASWNGRNGFAGITTEQTTRGIAVRWTPGGGHGGKRYSSATESIPAWRRRLRRVVILRRNGFEVIEKIDDAAGVVIYVDPPYFVKGGRYVHDFADGFMTSGNDHERLSNALSRFKKTRVVVSYYRDPALLSLYRGWTVRDVAITKGLHNAGKRGSIAKEAPEVLLINGPSYATEAA